MNIRIVTSSAAIFLLGTAVVFGQAEAPITNNPMTFFVTGTTPGGGDLSGLAGADRICQNLAASVGAGGKTWRAYLSQEAQGGLPRVDARSRIGNGPWYNAKGQLIASNLADLHGDERRDSNNLTKYSALTEKGERVPGGGDPMPSEHDMMTGSDSHGRAFVDGIDHTCKNWTSNAQADQGMAGHHDRMGVNNTSWNSSHMDTCVPRRDRREGRFYCFATN